MDGDADISAGYFLFRNDDGHFTEVAKARAGAQGVDCNSPIGLTTIRRRSDYMPEGDGAHRIV